ELREDVDTVIEPGMVISMEPMITVLDGEPGAGGYREHDIVVVGENGSEDITKFPFGRSTTTYNHLMASPPSDQSRRGASVIENTVAILRCFSPDRQELGVTEIAPEVGLHKSTVSRILAALDREGIVEQGASRRYRLGLGIIAIAGPLLADLDVRRAAYPILQSLTRATAETSALMVWDGTEAVTVEQIPSP